MALPQSGFSLTLCKQHPAPAAMPLPCLIFLPNFYHYLTYLYICPPLLDYNFHDIRLFSLPYFQNLNTVPGTIFVEKLMVKITES